MDPLLIDEEQAEREQLFDDIFRLLQTMPHPLRKVFILSHYHDWSTQEIAQGLEREELEIERLLQLSNDYFYSQLRRERRGSKQ